MNYLKYIIRYLNIAKHLLLTIIINQANSISKLYRVSELYPYVPFGSKNSFGTKLKEILGRIFFKKNVVPKESFFVASDVPILYNEPCICNGD